jgi:hypothetical protein
MIESGAGTGAALEGEGWKATRLVKTRAAQRRIIERCSSFFIGVILHLYSLPTLLQENEAGVNIRVWHPLSKWSCPPKA